MSGRAAPRIIAADEEYDVRTLCPQCGEEAFVPVRVAARLERTRAESRLGLKFGQEKVPHRCGQTSIQVVGETGEIVGQIDIDGRTHS